MIKSTLIYGLASMLPALLGFVLLPMYSKYLSAAEFGIIGAMGVLTGLISVFSNLALDRAALRFYFDSNVNDERKKVLSTFFLGSLAVAVVFFATLVLLKPLLTLAYPDIDFYPYYFLTIVTVSLSVCEVFVSGYFRVAEKPHQYLLMTFLTLCLQGWLIIYFVIIKREGAIGQIHAVLFSTLVLLPVYLTIAYRNFLCTFSWTIFKQGILFSWPFIPTLIIAWILNWSDSVFIANYGSMKDVGLYAMAYKISMLFFMITAAFAVTYQPIFFRKANENNQIAAKKSLSSIIYVASRAFIACGFLLALFSHDIVRLLLDEKYGEIYLIIRVILMSHILSAIMGISSNLYYLQSKRTKMQLAVMSLAGFVNVGLNYLLVPIYGIYGAAFATVFSMVFLTYIHYSYSKTGYFIDIHWAKLSILICASIATVLFFQMFIEGTWISLPSKIVFLLLLALALFKNKSFNSSIREFRNQ